MNKIKELRKERGWKQEELGRLLNVKSAAISKYENEHIPLTAETISMLCEIFNVSADYLLNIPNNKNSVTNYVQIIINSCSDLNEEELKKVSEYIDFLKSKR